MIENIPTLTVDQWAQQQWGSVELRDKRLNRRAVEIGKRMASKPEASLPQQIGDPSGLQAAYRLLNNRRVHMEELLKPHCQQTVEASRQAGVVLFVSDITELDYTFHSSKRGLGPIGNNKGRGLLMHSCLNILPESRKILGLSSVQVFLRETAPKPRPKYTRSAEGKVWEICAEQIGKAPEDSLWVHISDAGSDFYSYMATCLAKNKHFLVRVSRNRLVDWEEDDPQADDLEARKLVDYARSLPAEVGSKFELWVDADKERQAHLAQLVIAWHTVPLAPSPQAPPEERKFPAFTAWVLRVCEPDPPAGSKPVEWILLTSVPVLSLADAQQRIDWYSCRWMSEDFHQCLKTGCKIENSQLDDAEDLKNLLGLVAPIAIRLLQIRQEARQNSDSLAIEIIDPLMVTVLALHQKIDPAQMTILAFWRLVAMLGGFLGRKGDGFPGWRTIWRGWRYLSDLTDGARLLANHSPKRCV